MWEGRFYKRIAPPRRQLYSHCRGDAVAFPHKPSVAPALAPDVCSLSGPGLRHHVVDQPVLVPQAFRLEERLDSQRNRWGRGAFPMRSQT